MKTLIKFWKWITRKDLKAENKKLKEEINKLNKEKTNMEISMKVNKSLKNYYLNKLTKK